MLIHCLTLCTLRADHPSYAQRRSSANAPWERCDQEHDAHNGHRQVNRGWRRVSGVMNTWYPNFDHQDAIWCLRHTLICRMHGLTTYRFEPPHLDVNLWGGVEDHNGHHHVRKTH